MKSSIRIRANCAPYGFANRNQLVSPTEMAVNVVRGPVAHRLFRGRFAPSFRLDHFVKFAFDLGLKVGFYLGHLPELGKCPTPMRAEMIHPGHPIGVHSGLLFLAIFTAVTLDLDDEVKEVIVAVPIIHTHDEVREVSPGFRAVAVRYFQTEIVVLDVGADAGMSFRHTAELALPIAVEDHPVNVTASRVCFPEELSRSVEIDVHR